MRHRWWDGTKSFEYAFQQSLYITFNGVTIREVSGNGIGELDAFVSEPFCYRSFAAGVAAARSLEGLYTEKRIVGYSYNGVCLPGLPEWNADEYNRSAMVFSSGTRSHILLLFNDYVIEKVHDEDYITLKENSMYSVYDPQTNGWSDMRDTSATPKYKVNSVFWSNTNVYDGSDILRIEASMPIPIYE